MTKKTDNPGGKNSSDWWCENCHKKVRVAGSGEGTNHWHCDNCGKPVNAYQNSPTPAPKEQLDVKDYVEAAYLHGLCVENLDTGELEPPKDISEVQWIIAAITDLINRAKIEGMEQAKSRVLRRTEIPKDAREPTRDAIVILGEEIAGIISKDISTLLGEGENNG